MSDDYGDFRRGPSRDVESEADHWHPGDALAAPDIPPYPADWDSKQRVAVYWYAMSLRAIPSKTSGWIALSNQLEDAKSARERNS